MKYNAEKAIEVVSILKTHPEILLKIGQDILFVKTLETSVRKIEKLEKEVLTLKEKLNNKKTVFNQEKEIALDLVRNGKKIIKEELGKNYKPEMTEQPEIVEQPVKKEKLYKIEEPK